MAEATTAERDQRPAPPSPRARRLPRLPRPSRPRRRRTLVLLAVALLLLGGGVPWVLYGSDWLRVERVTVSWREGGPRHLTARQVLTAAAVPVGEPMISLDRGAVRERVLDSLPRVADVEVVRAWPHGVSLKVTERQAMVVMRTADGYVEVDAAGVPFAEVAKVPAGVPLLELDVADSPSLRRFDEERVRQGAVAVVAALPESLRRQVRVVSATSYDAVTLRLRDDRTVRWGSPEQSVAKAETLTRLMQAADDATHYDVSVPSAPAYVGG